jgi:hypothetical protein
MRVRQTTKTTKRTEDARALHESPITTQLLSAIIGSAASYNIGNRAVDPAEMIYRPCHGALARRSSRPLADVHWKPLECI